MPLYTVTTQASVLTAGAKAKLAGELTSFHAEYAGGMLRRLWELPRAQTGTLDDQFVIGIQEVPASQAMEMGTIMPDVAGQ